MTKNSKVGLGDSLQAAPLHEQIKDRILQRIILEEWPEGFVVPPETELAASLGVSYGTIRRAMNDLTAQGVIMRRRKTGTVVTGRTPHHTLSRFYRYYRLHTIEGKLINTDARVLSVDRGTATTAEAGTLRIASDADVVRIERLRIADGRPVMIDRCVIPAALTPGLSTEKHEVPALIYKWLLETYGIRLSAVRERITARLANPEDCRLLELDPSRPHALMEIRETAYDSRNHAILTMDHVALTDDHCYVNEVR